MPTPTQKTAMQEMIEWLNEFDNAPIKPTYANTREKAWQLLAIEKEQRENDYKQGLQDGYACMPTSLT